ncbi:SusC/RagA family TonB-linked outer membrane protein [Anseongella ginsenosidimutans]|nr:SusC/RagA family TonB-linked outer membrane protein [Anseongella ginsenosidimutans]
MSRKLYYYGMLLVLACCASAPAFSQILAAASTVPPGEPRDQRYGIKTLEKALAELQERYKVSFFYKTELIEGLRVDGNAVSGTGGFEKDLNELLRQHGLVYKTAGDNLYVIIPGKKEEKISAVKFRKIISDIGGSKGISGTNPDFSSGRLQAADYYQQNSVTGTVTSASDSTALPGVSVLVKGTQNGASTDMNGRYQLQNVPEDAILVFTFLGFQTLEQAVNGRSELNVALETDAESLEQVVVTGFGLSQKKESLTSAISTIGAEDISRSLSSTTSGALVGKIPGLNSRQTDGRPGASTALQIRNMGDPLYVIDGVQKDAGQFNNLNPADIASISVLKDASASIYGVRAANGVIVVTTKKGRRNSKNTVSITANYGLQDLSAFPKPADALTYIRSFIQSETVQGASNYTYSKEDLEKWRQGTEKGYVPFDWYDYIWETAPQYNVNASASGGSENINYYFSVGHLDQEANIVNYGGFTRTNVQMNVEANISERFKVGAGLNGRVEKRVNPGVPGGDDLWLPRFATYRNLPTVRPFANDNPDYPTLTSTDPGTNFAWLNYELSGKLEDTWRVGQLNFNAEYEIMDGLTAKGLVSYYYANRKMDNHEYTYKLYGYDEDTDTYPVIFENNNPWRERDMRHVEELTSNLQLAYTKNIADHNLTVIGGMETIKRDEPRTWVHSIPAANALDLIHFETLDTYDDFGDRTQARLGFVGRINYDYANKYLVELSARYDGSWKFPPGDRWGFFPSASAGWRISEESFWKDGSISNVFNDLKLRASYGLLGDDDLGEIDGDPIYSPFDYLGGYDYNVSGAVIDGEYVVGTVPRGLPVNTLSWIKARIFDVGIDASFLNSRLTVTVDYFQRKRTGLPAARYDILIPSEVGFGLPNENLNSDAHKGYDASVIWNDKAGDLTYSIGGNVTYSRFYDWEQYKPRFSNSWDEYRNSLVQRYGYLNWGLEADGQFSSWEEIASWEIDNDRQGNKTLRPGDIKYVDQNGDGVINGMDERPIGYRQNETPALNFGLNFGFGWKGFDLSFDLTGGGMFTFYQEWEQRNPFHDGGNNPQYYMENAWRLSDIWDPNSELIPGDYPMLLIGNSSHSNYWNSTFWKTNVRYIKLRNLELGYSLPQKLLTPLSLSNVRFYLAGQNLFTISNLEGVDPEGDATNGLGYPTIRIMNFGLNVQF